jgi:hypothetical protein
MEDFLAFVFEVVAELVLQLLGELILEVLFRAIGKLLIAIFESGPLMAALFVAVLGIASGVCSVAVLPHPLVHPSKAHGISLIVSPVITGLLMSQVGRILRRQGKRTIQLETFGFGFVFAFAMALVRLVLVK